ncbi:hydantoinase B/oxoprolinase family protein [Saccharomonospora sp. NPDC046836]|uniref:hydantoinase B/oxoprolinase family protein n=1 Tax=Saccharomonospora sp. NPDC046836 TaxID=3156921 RepID=UPI0033D8252E
MTATDEIDIVKAEITRNALLSAAQEMNDTLVRSAYNPLIFDVKDFGLGIMSAKGELWAEAPGLPVFIGVLPASVRAGIAKFGQDGFREGDVLIANSPYQTGTHISDTAVYMPVFYQGELVAFTGSMAHWADIGGMSPGGWTVDSTEIYQEGVRFTHQRLYLAGQPNRDVLELIEDNVRVSRIVMGDLHAQIATCRTGAERVIALCERYGADEVTRLMDYVVRQTEQALRAEVRSLPDGTYSASVRLDFNGVDHDEVPVIAVQTTIDGDRVKVTFDGTSGVSAGPINCGAEATASGVAQALKGILDPVGPNNNAHLSLAEIEFPAEPSLVSPVDPAPCDSYGYVMTALVETLQYALADIAPERGRAGSYQMWAEYIMSTTSRSARHYVMAEPVQGGSGAFPGHDGKSLIFSGDGDTWNVPVEVMETRYPVHCEQFALDETSAGAGEFRGGMGVRRDIRVLDAHSMIKTALENTVDLLSKGMHGGLTGTGSYTRLVFPGGEVRLQRERIGDHPVPQGTLVGIRTGGGGGFGDPLDRDPARVARDVRDEYVTPEAALELYGVKVVPGSLPGLWDVDDAATTQIRRQRKNGSPQSEQETTP